MIRDKFIALRLTKPEYQAIIEMAKIEGVTTSQLIRKSLDFYLANNIGVIQNE